MKRAVDRLAVQCFDLLVLGGGVTGAAVARAASRRGLAVALIDQGDFGAATSANSLKIIHGGLRYLQYGDIRQVRDAVHARREFFRGFPRLVSPLRCVVPTHGLGLRGRLAMGAALAVNDLLSFDRNRAVEPGRRIPRGRLLGRGEMLAIAPELAVSAPSGGALWHDGLALDTERIVLEMALEAGAHGAAAANYVRAEGFLREGDAVRGVRARDLVSDTALEIRARLVCNAAGPWFDAVNRPARTRGEDLPLAKAVNVLVARPLFGECAVGLEGGGGYRDERGIVRGGKRFFFFVPWGSGTMIGTLYLPHEGGPDGCSVEAADIERMTDEVNRIYPPARLVPDDVCFAHAGLLPLAPGPEDVPAEARLLRRTAVVDGARELGVEGLIGVRSVKYTAACLIAERVVDLAGARLGAKLRPPPTPALREPANVAPGVPPEAAARFAHLDGTRARAVLEIVAADARLARRIRRNRPTVAAEIVHAAREEMAVGLADVVLRRTPIGTSGHPGREALEAAASVAGDALGWDARRRDREIALVEQEYRRLLGRAAP